MAYKSILITTAGRSKAKKLSMLMKIPVNWPKNVLLIWAITLGHILMPMELPLRVRK
ncbi:hypothetical protein R5P80_04675 [Oenococcus oeni]